MRPRRYRLRLYVATARSILWALNRLSDWEINRMYPDADAGIDTRTQC
jgi:hypothetical protein